MLIVDENGQPVYTGDGVKIDGYNPSSNALDHLHEQEIERLNKEGHEEMGENRKDKVKEIKG